MNMMIFCYALSCWAQFCILTDSTPGAKGFFFFFLIALSFLSKLSRNSFFMHRRRRDMYDQIPAVSVNENKHAYQLQTGLMRYMILKLHGNATPSSCDQRLFFSLGASLLLDASSPRTINIVKKKRSSGTQGFLCRTAC